MQAIRKIIKADRLAPIVSLPKEMRGSDVEIIVLPIYQTPSYKADAEAVDKMLAFMDSRPRVNADIKALIEEGRD
jgi:hypothetical protein